MKIVSKFKDYYDGVANYGGHDDSIVYIRTTERTELIWKDVRPFQKIPNFEIKNKGSFDYFVIFAGRLYHGFFVLGPVLNPRRQQWETEKRIKTWHWNDFDFVKSFYDLREHCSYLETPFSTFLSYFEKDYTDFNLKHNSPIILIVDGNRRSGEEYYLEKNPCLSKISFAKAIEPFSAFQQLEGFVDTHFMRNVNLTQISNDSKIEKHGFDLKTSFRKEKSKK